MVNVVISGPCGIGKSTVAKSFAYRMKMAYLDFDELRSTDLDQRRSGISPCSVSALNLKECLSSKLDVLHLCFVLDIGGDTIFRPRANNEERLKQVFWLKTTYLTQIVILTATHDILLKRFTTCKNRKEIEFDKVWEEWLTIGKQYWYRCADFLIDTTYLTVNDIDIQIEEILKN
jgi:RNase adaptor protein for sRNA GlmZ degradation